jgi:hypothetical protein
MYFCGSNGPCAVRREFIFIGVIMDSLIRCYDCAYWGNGVWVDGFKMDTGLLPSRNEELYFACLEDCREKILQSPIVGPTLADDVEDIRVKNKNNDCSKFIKRTKGELLPEWVKNINPDRKIHLRE